MAMLSADILLAPPRSKIEHNYIMGSLVLRGLLLEANVFMFIVQIETLKTDLPLFNLSALRRCVWENWNVHIVFTNLKSKSYRFRCHAQDDNNSSSSNQMNQPMPMQSNDGCESFRSAVSINLVDKSNQSSNNLFLQLEWKVMAYIAGTALL